MLKAGDRIQAMAEATLRPLVTKATFSTTQRAAGPGHEVRPHSSSHVCNLSPQLINSLADEKVRWQDTVENLDCKINNITGDVLVAAGFVAYLGPFTVSVQCSPRGAPFAPLLSSPLAVADQIRWEKGSLMDLSIFARGCTGFHLNQNGRV